MKAKWFLGVAALLAMISLTGCPKETEPPVPIPTLEDFAVEGGERGTIDFRAGSKWRLVVLDKSWLRFVANDQDTDGAVSIVGGKGYQSVKFYVQNTGWNFENSETATVQLIMGDQGTVEFEVTRSAKVRGVKMYVKASNGTITQIDAVNFGYSNGRVFGSGASAILAFMTGYNIGFTANFDWKVKSVSSGVTFAGASLTGPADQTNEEATYKNITIDDEISLAQIQTPITGRTIVVTDVDEEYEFTFQVAYTGMADTDLMYVAPQNLATRPPKFSYNGYLLNADGNPTSGDMVIFEVKTQGMDYKPYVVDVNIDTFTITDVTSTGWLTVLDGQDGNIVLQTNATNNGADRTLYFMVLPGAYADDPKWNEVYNAETSDTYASIYLAKYAVAITQTAKPAAVTTGFFVGWGATNNTITQITDSNMLSPVNMSTEGYLPSQEDARYPDDNTWKFSISNAYINGSLWIAPIGLGDDFYGDFFKWEEVAGTDASWTVPEAPQNASMYSGATQLYGVKMDVEKLFHKQEVGPPIKWVFVSRKGNLLFYKSQANMLANGKADAVIQITQNSVQPDPDPVRRR